MTIVHFLLEDKNDTCWRIHVELVPEVVVEKNLKT